MKLIVNGVTHAVTSDADTPLLWVLRDELKLTGTKYGCGVQSCGACTVHLDGVPVRSCGISLEDLNAEEVVTTIEGLGEGGMHPLQQAWIEENVPQCGYCQSGQIMQAAGLLADIPAPADSDIDEAMSGNLCRCGTYSRIRQAIHKAAAVKREV